MGHDPQYCISDFAFTFEWECKRCGHTWPVNTHPTRPCDQDQNEPEAPIPPDPSKEPLTTPG